MSPITAEESATGELFQHSLALVETPDIGSGTRIAAFAHILPGVRIGRDCSIHEHTVLGARAVLGNRVTISSGVRLDDVELEDDVFVGPNAALSCTPQAHGGPSPHTIVRRGAFIGAAAAVAAGVLVGESAVISPGAVVSRNVPPNAIVTGNPAQIVGYVGAATAVAAPTSAAPASGGCKVRGVIFQQLPRFEDMRGALSVAEVQAHVPFPIQRFFLVYDVPSREIRGEHAHYTLHQFLICVHGSCAVLVDDGENRHEYRLETPGQGLYLPPMTWSVQYKHSPDAVLLVLASASYNAADYIRDYTTFVKAVAARRLT